MKTSFPSGPWTFTHEGGGSFYIRDNKGQQLIWIGNSTRFEKGECEALAQIVSSAPELLKALQAAIDCGMVPISSVSEGGPMKHSAQVKVADQIRSAISKALGESA